ncbi:2TM domain-containing protein [Flavobacterium sp.]|uniref:2TM domain-containing protein n=1 Tax=Flavobacterium sp. TaxID=239 RepID=UPI003527E7C8
MNYTKELAKATIIGVVIFFSIQLINFSYNQVLPSVTTLQWNFIFTLLYSVVLYFANAFVFIWVYKNFKSSGVSVKRLLLGFVASFFISTISIFILRVFEEVIVENVSIADFFKQEKIGNYVISLVITLIVSLVIHLIYFYKNYQENRVKKEKIIAGNASAQFESLKNQLDPHFLFNSLNVLRALIEENPDNAQKFTTSLSKVYRYVLEQRDKELVTIEEELNFARIYMNLILMRFENSISFELPNIENTEIADGKVVPLSLQLLLENCIKHNSVSQQKPLHIKIYVENNELIIENNLQKKEVFNERKGVGLQNIVSRYAILTDRKIRILESDAIFKVTLPILTKQIENNMNTATYNEELAYTKAKNRVKEIREFYNNLITYIVVIPFLILVNYKTSNFQWFWFPLFGWGFGIVMQAIQVFGLTKNWEERKINEILNKDNNERKYQ